MIRIITVSTQPPKYPAVVPIISPTGPTMTETIKMISQADTGAVHDTAEDVASEFVRAEPVCGCSGLSAHWRDRRGRVVAGMNGSEDGREHKDANDDQGEAAGWIAHQPYGRAPALLPRRVLVRR